MPVFDSTFRSAHVANLVQLESELENSLPARIALNAEENSVFSTTGSTVIYDQSFTINDDEVGLVLAKIGFAASATSILLGLEMKIDSTTIDLMSQRNIAADVAGRSAFVTMIAPLQNISSGSHSLNITLLVASGSGTVYATQKKVLILNYKRRT